MNFFDYDLIPDPKCSLTSVEIREQQLRHADIEELHMEALKYPVGSSNHEYYLNFIKNQLIENPRYKEYVLCFNSGISEGYKRDDKYEILFGHNGMYEHIWNSLPLPQLFNGELKILPRWEVEYNKKYKQLCVALIIKQGDKLILLQNTDNHRLANRITMIQGHVDYDKSVYNTGGSDYLKRTIKKELFEEIEGINLSVEEIDNLLNLTCCVNNEFGDFISLEHVGLVFVLNLPWECNVEDITSKEPEKHNVTIMNLNEIKNNIELCDEWLASAIRCI